MVSLTAAPTNQGVLFLIHRYGLRSVVYLKDKSGLVAVPMDTKQMNTEGATLKFIVLAQCNATSKGSQFFER